MSLYPLQHWLQFRDEEYLWRLGNLLSSVRYWLWRATGQLRRRSRARWCGWHDPLQPCDESHFADARSGDRK